MEQININYGGQDSQLRASSVIPANYDDLQDQLQAALTRVVALVVPDDHDLRTELLMLHVGI